MYDIIFLTNIPAFYKINLYNEINKEKKILVIFMANKSLQRKEDFYKGDKNFDFIYLDKNFYEQRNIVKNFIKLIRILFKLKYKLFIIGGWDSIENWIACIINKKEKNGLVMETSNIESSSKGLKGILKRIFLFKIKYIFASGELQKKLIENLNKKKQIIITYGVGIFNYNKDIIKKEKIKVVKKFLYVGRLEKEKNIEELIKVFNKLPELELNIVGYGSLEKDLKRIAKNNINFLGEIQNKELNNIYIKNDIFILPSLREPWGLVVEEALNNKLPVIISDKVGCKSLVEKYKVGFIYDVNNEEELIKKIEEIIDIKTYMYLLENIEKIDSDRIRKKQIMAYFIEER